MRGPWNISRMYGDREMENNEISVRKRGGEDLGSMSIEAFVELVNNEALEG